MRSSSTASSRTSSGTLKALLKDGGKEYSARGMDFPAARRMLTSAAFPGAAEDSAEVRHGQDPKRLGKATDRPAGNAGRRPLSVRVCPAHVSPLQQLVRAHSMSPIVQTTLRSAPGSSSRTVAATRPTGPACSTPRSHEAPFMAPAPQITSRRSARRNTDSRAPPSLSRANHLSTPAAPDTRLHASSLLSCNLQNQAEKDAIDSLLFMSSPNNSNNMKHPRDSSPSFDRKRVELESPPDVR